MAPQNPLFGSICRIEIVIGGLVSIDFLDLDIKTTIEIPEIDLNNTKVLESQNRQTFMVRMSEKIIYFYRTGFPFKIKVFSKTLQKTLQNNINDLESNEILIEPSFKEGFLFFKKRKE